MAGEEKINCPLCGGGPVSGQISAPGWRIVSCHSCTNAWTLPPPPEVAYSTMDFHAQFPYRTAADLPRQWKKALRMQADLIERALPRGARLLEIGCGQGLLLGELARRGMAAEGIEPSESAAQKAREAGLKVATGYFPHPSCEGPFDVVVMSHVLEHVRDPRLVLQKVAAAAPGRLALFVQTHWRGLVPRLQKAAWYAWVPEQHFWHFTPRGMAAFLGSLGWKVECVEYSSLEHRNSLVSLMGEWVPGWGDQFHLLARIIPT